jgi:hypothetical protein
MSKKSTLAIVVIVAVFGLAISLSIVSTIIPKAHADFQRPFGEPPGLHKNKYGFPGHACDQKSITKESNPSPVGQSCRD